MSDLADRFRDRFHGLERAHGSYRVTGRPAGKQKVEGEARTRHEPVTLEVWRRHLAGQQGLGIVPIRDDGTCVFGAIDIDVYDLDLVALSRRIIEARLPIVPCRTKSGGCHGYLFTSEPVPASLMRQRLMEIAVFLGFPGVEIFPKQVNLASEEDVGNWINMPYFQADRSLRYALGADGQALSATEFLDLASERACNGDDLQQLRVPTDDSLADAPPCLQCLAQTGCSEFRNNALFNFGVYFRRSRPPEQLPTLLSEANRRYMSPPLPDREISGMTKSNGRKDYSYMCDKPPISQLCNRPLCVTRRYGVTNGGDGATDPGVYIGQLTKRMTEPVVWVVQVDGVRMEMNTEDLMNQDRFRRVCLEKSNRLPNRMKTPRWEAYLQELLKNVLIQEAPPDAGPAGQFWAHLEDYCTGRAQARTKDELLQGKPWTDGGRTYFRSKDLMRYLHQQHFRIPEDKVWSYLQQGDAQHHEFNLKGKFVRCWSVPEFNRQKEDFEVPRRAPEGEF